MTTIKTNGKEILAVEAPEDAHEKYYDIWNGILCENTRLTQHDGLYNCKIIGLLRDLSESECERLVEKSNEPVTRNGYKNYSKSEPYWFWEAKESLISLLQANGLNTSNNLLLIEKI